MYVHMHTYVHCSTVYDSKDLEPTQMPINDRWTKNMWCIYTMEYYAAIKNHEFMSFVETWMNLETIILSKLTQEQKTKHHMFSLIGGWWTMRTLVHREGNITHWGLSGGGGLGRESIRRNTSCRWWVDGCSKPPCHMNTYVINLHILYMYPRT